jgi:hypothetical protein
MFCYLVCAALFAGSTPPSHPAVQVDPEGAARVFSHAIKVNDWSAAARAMHPHALKQLRELFQPLVNAPGGDQLLSQLFGVPSAAAFAKMPDTVMFANFLRAAVGQEAGMAEALRTANVTPLGHIQASGDTVLVVSRTTLTVQGVTITQFEVMPFVREGGRWWGLLKADFTNMAALLRRSLGAKAS